MSDDQSVAVTVPVTLLPEDFDTNNAYALARDVATSLVGLTPVLAKHKLTPAQYALIEQNDFYKRALDSALEEWNSIKSTPQRATMKAALILEDGMAHFGGRMQDSKEPLASVAQMAKVVGDIAGFNKQNNGPQAQEKVTISIDFGADTKLVVEKTIEGAVEASPLQAHIEGPRNKSSLQQEPEGTSALQNLFTVPPA